MNNKELIEKIYKKYNMEIDYIFIGTNINSLIEEYNYLRETYFRIRLNKRLVLAPYVESIEGVTVYNDLFIDHYFNFYLKHAKHHRNELESFYKAVLFFEKNFYICDDWNLKKAKLLKKMLEDEDLNKMCLRIFDKNSWEFVRESSFYYNVDVWKFVSKNKLLPYMRQKEEQK